MRRYGSHNRAVDCSVGWAESFSQYLLLSQLKEEALPFLLLHYDFEASLLCQLHVVRRSSSLFRPQDPIPCFYLLLWQSNCQLKNCDILLLLISGRYHRIPNQEPPAAASSNSLLLESMAITCSPFSLPITPSQRPKGARRLLQKTGYINYHLFIGSLE